MKKPDHMIRNSRQLRKHMTKEEMHLWLDFLKKLPYSVRRQKVMEKYILDFYIPDVKIAIEIDGRQHGKEDNKAQDWERDRFLSGKGIKVLRYSNVQVNDNFSMVCKDIQKHYDERKRNLKSI